ncbi:MAG: Riboflavin synthase alpha chain [Candidatus Magasanikbacteria bacterium GW2011_GWD2_43_18]|uniref:Riboflavin synthase n=1 Tax=Candidatus Magasanikbacteria bacterium GW2011_GWE2_42_7 TaxID=1619052 RepID=A0A0G1BFZ7_9BACT|nr:MAG: Riboflavin synthase alpha chain [Candidatus Magasanikbacteria bacterium GW2011_GWC2_42_27]KKS72207.1 MAG: Riboflavin synthase alpha chain [Candidatus Magasanikbacteria bacterium GW2011_GWE2_42_7]KKT04932.1 MAG: Riboflavin synthase alpha chain [Candidatus Magasanikbacteria bacterium GW2011_GWD2_43_18]KKT24375.1 MAG: Riboflavin synthase alpha chain [Candidatus Magasanikbacteria bacterium GW2011_GWA2_43_9]HBB37791.1 riboflavin synthase [Candidatus Magasanikbacteria bacterium]
MFSGIIQSIVPVSSFQKNDHGATLTLHFTDELLHDLKIGASVSVAGVCLTVVNIADNEVSFDLSNETLNLTTLGAVNIGDDVNIERSIYVGDEIGGHLLSGHVHGIATLLEKQEDGMYRFQLPEDLKKFVFEKGFIALDGVSLTVVDYDKESGAFLVAFIPETLRTTTFGNVEIGDRVHVEVDQQTRAVVETVERMMSAIA